jgi:hypothetical protein
MTPSTPDLTFLKPLAPMDKQRFSMLMLVLSHVGAQSTNSAAQRRTESIWVSYLGTIVAAGDGVTVNMADVLPPPTTTTPPRPNRPATHHTTRIPATTTPHATPTTASPGTAIPTTSPIITGRPGRPPIRPSRPPTTSGTPTTGKP